MNIDQLGAQQIKDLLPYGGLKKVQERLKEKGINFSYVTVQKFENSQVVNEAVAMLQEMAEDSKTQLSRRKDLIKKLNRKLGLPA